MFSLPNQAIFVPAKAIIHIDSWNKTHEYIYNDHDDRFFTPKSYFQYPYLLTTTYYELESGSENFRDLYKYPNNHCLIADSGGFQIATNSIKGRSITITPIQVLRWMEDNADIGMNLDVPPWTNFNDSLKKSLDNFQLFEKSRINYNMKLYNVLHGKTLSEMKVWYDAVKCFDSFNGWALGVRPANNVYLQVVGYLFLHDMDALHHNTNFHLFGVSGIKNMLMLSLLSNHFESSITFDSSSYTMGSRFRKWMFPKDLRFGTEFGRSSNLHAMNSIPCDCPVCRNNNIYDLYKQEGKESASLITLHNLYQYIEVNRIINSLVTDDYAFNEYAKSVNEQEMITIVNKMLEDYHKKGVDYVYAKYKHLMTLRKPACHESNLWSFGGSTNE